MSLESASQEDFETVLDILLQFEKWPFSEKELESFLTLISRLFFDDKFEKDAYLAGTMAKYLCKNSIINPFDALKQVEFDSHLKASLLECIIDQKDKSIDWEVLRSLLQDPDLEVRALVGEIAIRNSCFKEAQEFLEILKNDESFFVRSKVDNQAVNEIQSIQDYLEDYYAYASANISQSHDCYC
jgi:hypothetical protein